MSFSIDDSELRAVAANMGRIASKALPQVDAVVKKGAQNIKDEMVEDLGSSHSAWKKANPRGFRVLMRSISYDTKYGIGSVGYEIGPDKARGGSLGNIYYFGGSRGGGHGDLEGPLRSEEPRLRSALGDLLGDLGGGI